MNHQPQNKTSPSSLVKSAFSLVEISIVIVIIGILIAGISKGADLYADFKLTTARNLTINSRVGRIPDLVLWVEATSEKSFPEKQNINGTNISQWNDLNPQIPFKDNLTCVPSSSVIFQSNAINSLPAVYFNGGGALSNSLSGKSDGNVTIFVVYRNLATTGDNNWRQGINARRFLLQKAGGIKINQMVITFPSVIDLIIQNMTNSPEIFTGIHDPNNSSSKTRVYLNYRSSPYINNNSYLISNPTQLITLGSAWFGYIGEAIVFERALNESERIDVEDYLSKKWSIPISR